MPPGRPADVPHQLTYGTEPEAAVEMRRDRVGVEHLEDDPCHLASGQRLDRPLRQQARGPLTPPRWIDAHHRDPPADPSLSQQHKAHQLSSVVEGEAGVEIDVVALDHQLQRCGTEVQGHGVVAESAGCGVRNAGEAAVPESLHNVEVGRAAPFEASAWRAVKRSSSCGFPIRTPLVRVSRSRTWKLVCENSALPRRSPPGLHLKGRKYQ